MNPQHKKFSFLLHHAKKTQKQDEKVTSRRILFHNYCHRQQQPTSFAIKSNDDNKIIRNLTYDMCARDENDCMSLINDAFKEKQHHHLDVMEGN